MVSISRGPTMDFESRRGIEEAIMKSLNDDRALISCIVYYHCIQNLPMTIILFTTFAIKKVEIHGLKTLNMFDLPDIVSKLWCRHTPVNFFLNLESLDDGSQIQDALLELTGQRTVPNVSIGGKHVGGCEATTALHRGGKLVPLLTEAGVVKKSSA